MFQPIILWGYLSHIIYGTLMTLTAVFLILLVLVQRGRGGGLAGAFGGMGGQSAFGTKAGDTFTKITIGASIFWLLLCISAVKFLGSTSGAFGTASTLAPASQPESTPGGSTTDGGDGLSGLGGSSTPSTPAGTGQTSPSNSSPDATNTPVE